jgi:hypothetical protein
LRRSCLFLPLISADAIKPIEQVSIFDDKADNLLLEYETALKLARLRRIAIFPLLVGRVDPHGDYITFGKNGEFNVDRFPRAPSKTCSHTPGLYFGRNQIPKQERRSKKKKKKQRNKDASFQG